VIDGADDPLIPQAGRQEMEQAEQARNAQGRFTERWSAPGANHLQAYGRHPEEYEQRVSRFLQALA
jgi:hypothetical protein